MKQGSGNSQNIDQATLNDDWWQSLFAKDDLQELIKSEGTGVAISEHTSAPKPKHVVNTDWIRVQECFVNESLLECIVVECNRGGLLVQHKHFEGFVPLSHLLNDKEEILSTQLEQYIGRLLQLKIIEQDPERLRVILSERNAKTQPGAGQKLLQQISSGQSISGSVTTITKFGVFVDIGGIEGLIHISEISWRRISQPAKFVGIGDQLEALVLKVDQDRQRVALSLKQLRPNPWKSVQEDYSIGDVVMVEVTEVVRFGAFAKLNDDLEGLIHISAMNLAEGVLPWQTFKVGQQISVKIQKIDPAKQRLSLILNPVRT